MSPILRKMLFSVVMAPADDGSQGIGGGGTTTDGGDATALAQASEAAVVEAPIVPVPAAIVAAATTNAASDNPVEPGTPLVAHAVAATGAATVVVMSPPETGAANPQTVSIGDPLVPQATYAAPIGGSANVDLHHVEEMIANGWVVIQDKIEGGWAAAVAEFKKLREEVESLPHWFHALDFNAAKAKLEGWFSFLGKKL